MIFWIYDRVLEPKWAIAMRRERAAGSAAINVFEPGDAAGA